MKYRHLILLSFILLMYYVRESSAASFYNEATDGDLSSLLSTPSVLATLSAGSNQITGSVGGIGDPQDIGSFIVPVGFQLDKVLFTSYSSFIGNSTAFSLFAGPQVSFGSEIEFINLSSGGIGIDFLQFDSAPGPQSAGTYTFLWGPDGISASYILDIQLSETSSIPEPPTIYLVFLFISLYLLKHWRQSMLMPPSLRIIDRQSQEPRIRDRVDGFI